MIPQDILYVKKYFLYIVFDCKFSEQNHKIYLYVYNTALIRVMGCFAIPVRINAVLFPFYEVETYFEVLMCIARNEAQVCVLHESLVNYK